MNVFDNVDIAKKSFSYGDLLGQDRFIAWTPVRTGWTDVGTPAVTGRFHVIGRQVFGEISVIPSTTIATTAGTSYVDLPIVATGLAGGGQMHNNTSNVPVGSCGVNVSTSRLYVPSQVASGNIFTISFWYEI